MTTDKKTIIETRVDFQETGEGSITTTDEIKTTPVISFITDDTKLENLLPFNQLISSFHFIK